MTKQTINATKAKTLMFQWQGGMSCPLYALASGGEYLHPDRAINLLRIGTINPNYSEKERKEWAQMLAFVEAFKGSSDGKNITLPWHKSRS